MENIAFPVFTTHIISTPVFIDFSEPPQVEINEHGLSLLDNQSQVDAFQYCSPCIEIVENHLMQS
jgi:hypothetical protein